VFGRAAPGWVGVESEDGSGPAGSEVWAELVGVPVGERGAEGGQADRRGVGVLAGEGDGPGVEQALDQDRLGAGVERGAVLVVAVEAFTLAV
jgi:hypothetical protein